MLKIIKLIFVSFFLVFILLNNKVVAEAENEELRIILESIQKDIKILEKAVYSEQKTIKVKINNILIEKVIILFIDF